MSTGSQWIASRTFGLGCTYLRCIPRMRLAHSTRPWARRARKSSAGIRRGGQTTLVTAVCSWRMTPTSAPCRSLEQRSPSGHHARMESATAAILASPRESGRVAAVGSFDAPWAHRSHRYRSQAVKSRPSTFLQTFRLSRQGSSKNGKCTVSCTVL